MTLKSAAKETVRKLQCRVSFGMAAFTSFALTCTAFAEEIAVEGAEHGASHTAHHGGIADTIPYWVNFLIYCFVLYFLLNKKLSKSWKDRAHAIEALVKKGEIEMEAAKKELAETELRIAKVSSEESALASQIERDSQKEADQIKREATDRAARVVAQAKELAEAERKATENAIKKELADLVIEKATARLQKELTSENDASRRAASLQGLKGLIEN